MIPCHKARYFLLKIPYDEESTVYLSMCLACASTGRGVKNGKR